LKPLSPEALNKQTYLEIFNSQKESMKKPLNYINYSNQTYDVLNNNSVGGVYDTYVPKKIDYEKDKPLFCNRVLSMDSNRLNLVKKIDNKRC